MHRIPLSTPFVVFLALIALAPTWLISGVYWDGWIYEAHLHFDLHSETRAAFDNNGRPAQGWLITQFDGFESPNRAGNLVMSAFCALAAGAAFSILSKGLQVPKGVALLAVLLGVLHPAYLTAISLSMLGVHISLGLFWIGLWAAMQSQLGLRLLWMPVAVLFICASFIGEVTVLMTPLVSVLLYLQYRAAGLPTRDALRGSLRRGWWAFGLSGIGLVVILVMFPTSGNYAAARGNGLSLVQPFLTILTFVLVTLLLNFLPLVWAVVIKRRYRIEQPVSAQPWLWSLFCFGAIGFALSVLPYVLAGREPEPWGWRARFMLFSALPIGMILAALCHSIVLRVSPRSHRAIRALPTVFVIWAFVIVGVQSIAWQARWVRDTAVFEAISALPASTGLVIVEDAQAMPFGEKLRPYEWQSMGILATERRDIVATSAKIFPGKGINAQLVVDTWVVKSWSSQMFTQPLAPDCRMFVFDSRDLFRSLPWHWGKVVNGLDLKPKPCTSSSNTEQG